MLFEVQFQRQSETAANGAKQRVGRSGDCIRSEAGCETKQRQDDAADGEEGEYSEYPLRQNQSRFEPLDLPLDTDAALFEFDDPRM